MIIRDDLPIGNLAAQIVHAAGESSQGNLPEGTYAVVLGVKAEELHEVHALLKSKDIKHKLIFESDEPYTGQLMAIGVVPSPKSEVYPHLRHLNLLGAKVNRDKE